MKFKLCLIILIAFIALPACKRGASDIQRLTTSERMLRSRGDYDADLTLEYLEFSRSLNAAKKTKEAKYFVKKAAMVMDGLRVVPENPLTWKADKAQLEEMLLMQKRLELVLQEPQLKQSIPIQLAHLTYLYDCWISRESKAIFRTADLAYCKSRFYKLIDEIEYYIDESKKDNKPQVKIKAPEFKRFEVLFDAGSAELNSAATKDIITSLQYITQLDESYFVLVVGNADRADLSIMDKNLAFKRAEVVREYLIKNGVDRSVVQLRSIGEDFPDIISNSGENLQSNRKVGIYILKGVATSSEVPLPEVKNNVYKAGVQEARKARGR